VHSPDWDHAWQSVDRLLKERLSTAQLQTLDARYAALADTPGRAILAHGAGWGALELARRQDGAEPRVPASFVFPASSLGTEQQKWLSLLRTGTLPSQSADDTPGEWMVQPEWRAMLESTPDTHQNWYALLHLGVMRMEHFDAAGAQDAWEASLAIQPSAWAWRNLAVLALSNGHVDVGRAHMAHAWALRPATMEIAQEYMELLCAAGDFDAADTVYRALPAAVRSHDRIQILLARIALERGDYATVEQLMQHEYAVVREGETELTDIWFELHYRRYTPAGTTLSEEAKAEVRRLNPPPVQIDFRAITK
jgi:Tfp pilus assembly protein PilF